MWFDPVQGNPNVLANEAGIKEKRQNESHYLRNLLVISSFCAACLFVAFIFVRKSCFFRQSIQFMSMRWYARWSIFSSRDIGICYDIVLPNCVTGVIGLRISLLKYFSVWIIEAKWQSLISQTTIRTGFRGDPGPLRDIFFCHLKNALHNETLDSWSRQAGSFFYFIEGAFTYLEVSIFFSSVLWKMHSHQNHGGNREADARFSLQEPLPFFKPRT